MSPRACSRSSWEGRKGGAELGFSLPPSAEEVSLSLDYLLRTVKGDIAQLRLQRCSDLCTDAAVVDLAGSYNRYDTSWTTHTTWSDAVLLPGYSYKLLIHFDNRSSARWGDESEGVYVDNVRLRYKLSR